LQRPRERAPSAIVDGAGGGRAQDSIDSAGHRVLVV